VTSTDPPPSLASPYRWRRGGVVAEGLAVSHLPFFFLFFILIFLKFLFFKIFLNKFHFKFNLINFLPRQHQNNAVLHLLCRKIDMSAFWPDFGT